MAIKLQLSSIPPSEITCEKILKNIILKELESNHFFDEFYWKNDKKMFESKRTKKRYSLKSETLMKRSKLPINYWVFAFHCIINKNDYSKRKIQLILGHDFYEPVSYMYDKIMTQIKRCNQAILNEMQELNIENPFDQLLARERISIFNNMFNKANADETENFQYSDEELIEEYLIFLYYPAHYYYGVSSFKVLKSSL